MTTANVAGYTGSATQEQILSAIMTAESGGKNIFSNISVPGYTQQQTGSGYYQIIPSTWATGAKEAGVDISQYPLAIDAPYDVQTQVASALLANQGLQPWAGSKAIGLINQIDTGGSPALVSAPSDSTGSTDTSGNTSTSTGSTDTSGNTSTSTSSSDYIPGTSIPTIQSVTGTNKTGLLDYWTGLKLLVLQSLVFLGGLAFVLIAIGALLWRSKTVQATVRTATAV